MKEALDHSIFRLIGEAADELGYESYLIGGYVRDLILKRKKPKDIDVVAVGSGIELAQLVAQKLGGKKVNVFKNFGTAQVVLKEQDLELEFVGARKESYQRDSRKPIVENGTREDDQKRRDFTINALAISLNASSFGEMLDPFNGLQDLKDGIIRTPLDPHVTFSDDPLRMMRAIRFASQLDFTIEESSLEAIKEQSDRLQIISMERIMEELNKIMSSPKPSKGLILLYRTGLLNYFLPEVVALQGVEEIEGQSHKDNFYHTAQVVDNVALRSTNIWLRYAALFHDIGKPPTKRFVKGTGWTFHNHEFIGSKMVFKIFRRLKLPLGDARKYVQKMVLLSSRPQAVAEDQATDSAARRLLFDAGEDLEELMILCESDLTTRNEKKKRYYLRKYQEVRERLAEVEEKDRLRSFQPPIDGTEIMDLYNLKPGREIGILKSAVKDAILDGKIDNDRQQALIFLKAKAQELGLEPKQNHEH